MRLIVHLDDLTGRRVALLGLGSDVTAAVPVIEAAAPAALIAVEAGDLHGIDLPIWDLADAARWADVFVRSPGFPRYADALVEARERGAVMTTPLDLWMGTVGPQRTVIAVTGTKGKSTVTELIGGLAGQVGLRVGVAGNLGVPVFDAGWDADAPIVVLEVSSYQAADLHHVPDVAVLTFLAEDHLSWHGGRRDWYVADKLRVLRNESGTAARILLPADAGDAAEALVAIGLVAEVVTPPPAPVEVPRHRVQNAALAAAALAAVGGDSLLPTEIVAAARSSLPGRLDTFPGPEGLLCVDDALASNPSAVAAGLSWARGLDLPTIVILGGSDRGVSVDPLRDEVARWAPGLLRAITVPANGEDLAAGAGIGIVHRAADVTDAANAAVAATRTHPSGAAAQGVVLFSPGAPTPPEVGTWITRSHQFRQALEEPL